MNLLPTLCCFPTTVAIVDDSESFLSIINLKLESSISRRLYASPKKALTDIIKQKTILNKFLMPVKEDELDLDETTASLVSVNFPSISEVIYNKNRFSYVSVVVVDYHMPKLNGIDFCRKLPKQLKKILITTRAEYNVAVKAFNEKLIDKFIVKNQDGLFKEINDSIYAAKQSYFEDIFGIKNIINNINVNGASILTTKEYIQFFKDFYHKIKAVEFYLLDKDGSFLFLDINGNPTWLIIKSKTDVENLYDIASYDPNVSEKIKVGLKERKLCPIFLQSTDYEIPPSKWKTFPLLPLSRKGDYYYTSVSGKTLSNIDFKRVLSYKAYLNTGQVKLAK